MSNLLQRCTNCGQDLPLSEFCVVKSGPAAGRVFRQCKRCQQLARRAREAANPDKYSEGKRQKTRRWRAANLGQARESTKLSLRRMRAEEPARFQEYERRRYEKDRDKRLALNREGERRVRRDVLTAYGHRCSCCGIANAEFLAVDHVNGGGTRQRKSVGTGVKELRWIRRQGYPPEFRLLCHNCNRATHVLGCCPHLGLPPTKQPASQSRFRLRMEVLHAYGARCRCCSESELAFLVIDHTNGDGASHRREVDGKVYRWLREQGYPNEGFRVLCDNCNSALAWYRACPHTS